MADFAPTHPGEILLVDFLNPMGLSQYALAKALQVPLFRISEIVHAKRAITPDTALRLARYFGTSAELWMGYKRLMTWKWRATPSAPESWRPFDLTWLNSGF